jgi:hypothetical protein
MFSGSSFASLEDKDLVSLVSRVSFMHAMLVNIG